MFLCRINVLMEFLEKPQKLEVVSNDSLTMHIIVNGTIVDNDFLTQIFVWNLFTVFHLLKELFLKTFNVETMGQWF